MHLVEQDDNLSQLLQSLNRCAQGYGGVALVNGTVSSGKTALFDVFSERAAASGALVVRAVGSSAERTLPLGVIRQIAEDLISHPSVDLERRSAPARKTDVYPAGVDGSDYGSALEAVDHIDARFIHEMCGALGHLAHQTPIVIVIDSLEQADSPSLRGCLYLARQLRTTRTLLVLGESTHSFPAYPRFYTELIHQSHSVTIRLAPLSVDGVARLLSQQIDTTTANRLASRCHGISGGNPGLVTALVEDYLAQAETGEDATESEPVVGEVFAQTIITCLHRGDARVLWAARAAAILGEEATATSVARLLGVDVRSAKQAVHTLGRMGLLHGYKFRHPNTRAAILEEMDDDTRSNWHLRAAELLRRQGAVSSSVSRQLVAARRAPDPWGVEVLRETAARATADHQNRLAADCLRLALDSCTDPRQRAQTTVALANVEWAMSPATARRHTYPLMQALRRGDLDKADGVVVAMFFAWYGYLDEAAEAFAHGVISLDGERSKAAELRIAREWLCFTFPALQDVLPEFSIAGATAPSHSLLGRARQAAAALATALRDSDDERSVQLAEAVLQSSDLNNDTVGPVVSALFALIRSGRAGAAAPWCDLFIERAVTKEAPTWRALLLAIKSEIAICKGDVAAAEIHARAALSHIDQDGWGVTLALPVANLLLALNATGQHDIAAKYVTMVMPATILDSRYGLRYVYARGQHYLAVGRLEAALGDFLSCGELMVGWDMDVSWIATWRLGAAEVCLRLGNLDRCRQYAQEQLDVVGRKDLRATGISLRLLAAASEAKERRLLLRESVQVLESCNDSVELAKSLVDLSDVYQSIGALGKARLLARRATRMTDASGGSLVAASLDLPSQRPLEEGSTAVKMLEPGRLASLTEAERRVGDLAARGYSNGEIARRLYITVSTVEQHLTKVYRKLRIDRRSDLPISLKSYVVEIG